MTMKKYIDANALYDTIDEINRYDDFEDTIIVGDALQAILDAPAADVEKVKRGNWVLNRDGYICCSKCGCEPYRNSRVIDFDNLWKRCPNCGAKMDGKEIEK